MAIIESASTDVLLEREERARAAPRGASRRRRPGRGRFVLVGGEAGVGKTSLVRRFCEELPGGTAVFWGGCDPLATPRPLGPFLEIAERARGAIDGVLDPWSARTRRRRRASRAPRRPAGARRRRRGRALGGRGHAGRAAAARRGGTPRPRVSRSSPTATTSSAAPIRSASRSEISRPRPRSSGSRSGPSPATAVARLAEGARRRRRHRLATHVGQPVLRRRAPRARRARDTRLGPRRRAGAGRAARPTGDSRRRGGGDRATLARRGAPARRVRRGDRRRRRVHRERRSPHRRRRRRIPARALARGRRGVAVARPATRVASLDAAGADGLAPCGRRPGTDRASRRGGGRPRGRAPVRAGGGRAGSRRRRVPRGSGPVRARPPLRRRPRSRRPRRPPRGSFPGVLPRGRPDRGDRGDSRGDPVPAGGGHPARGSARAHRAHRLPLVPRLQRRGGRVGRARVATRCGASRATRARVRLSHAGPPGPVLRRRRRMLRARPPCARDRCALRRRAHRGACARHDRQRNGTQRPRARPAPDRGGRRDRPAERRARGRRTRHEQPRLRLHAVEPPRPRRAVHRRRDRVLHRAHTGPVAHQRPGGRSPLGPRSRSLGRRGPACAAR